MSGTSPPGARRHRMRDLRKYVTIIRELAIADFRLKYHDSALGYIWSMLNPLLMFVIYYFVFTRIFPSSIAHYPLFLMAGILNYAFFQDCTFSAMNSLFGKSHLMKKIYFPKSVIIFASSITCSISLLINTVVLLLMALLLKGPIPLMVLLPLPVICLILFSVGMAFILATLFAYFRDMSQIWGVLVLVIFWVSPIVFDVDVLPQAISNFVYFNPLTRIFGLIRHYTIYNYFNLRFLLMTVLYSLAVFAAGYLIFRRHEDRIAELF
ncbi:MAG TPA: ABC transporter permease [Bacteroidota bacterium]|nr:ABC transporter permease [Bacteroidota bacterium]